MRVDCRWFWSVVFLVTCIKLRPPLLFFDKYFLVTVDAVPVIYPASAVLAIVTHWHYSLVGTS